MHSKEVVKTLVFFLSVFKVEEKERERETVMYPGYLLSELINVKFLPFLCQNVFLNNRNKTIWIGYALFPSPGLSLTLSRRNYKQVCVRTHICADIVL